MTTPIPQPESQPENKTPTAPVRKRPYWLRTMLLLWMFFSAISAYIYLRSLSGVWIAITPLGHPSWTLPIFFVLSLVNLVCTLAIWNWKKWGMYGLAASGTAMFIVTLVSLNVTNAIISIVGIVIIGLLVRKVWHMMT